MAKEGAYISRKYAVEIRHPENKIQEDKKRRHLWLLPSMEDGDTQKGLIMLLD